MLGEDIISIKGHELDLDVIFEMKSEQETISMMGSELQRHDKQESITRNKPNLFLSLALTCSSINFFLHLHRPKRLKVRRKVN